jgi:formate dehydrogenase gamma subunit
MKKIFPFLIITLCFSFFLFSQEIKNSDCLSCHNDSGLSKEKNGGGKTSIEFGGGKEQLTLFVKEEDLKKTPHEGFNCIDCHKDIKEVPHKEILEPVKCGDCHDDVIASLKKSIHFGEGDKGRFLPTCSSCHGAHKIYPKSDKDSSIFVDNQPQMCGSCHSDSEKMREFGIKISNPIKDYSKSNHSLAIQKGNTNSAVCSSCHGSHDILPSTSEKSKTNRKNIPETCGKCHKEISDEFLQSIHGKALLKGVAEVPTCTTCHSEHDIEGPERKGSPVSSTLVAEKTCSPCHSSITLSRKFGIKADRVETFKNSFHGLSMKLGDTRVANCASCHGVHNILPGSDPKSTINKDNLKNTCGKCHPGASETFSQTPVHLSVSSGESKILKFIKVFYIYVIILTLGGMFFHNLLDYIRRYIEALKKIKLFETYERMTLTERWQHFALFTSFIILVITGFALKYPDSILGYPFKIVHSGFELRGIIHRIAALVMIIASIYHLCFLIFTKRGRSLISDMIPKVKDVVDVINQIKYFFGLRNEPPHFDRFSYIEKGEYLALIWGTAVMVLTGLILWFKTFFLKFLPDWGFPASEMIHFYEAILATFSIIIWHFYTVFSHTKFPPYNTTVLTGKMTKDELEHHHPLWLEKIEREEFEKQKQLAKEKEKEDEP